MSCANMEEIVSLARRIAESPLYTGEMLFAEPLAPRTTMQVGGPAAALAVPADGASAAYAAACACRAGLPLFILGGGSNIIVRDEGLDALVISLERLDGISYADGLLTAGAGAKFDAITAFCASHCLKGLSSFAGLPGTAGGAAFMNARCYGVSAGDLIQSVSYVDLDGLSEEKRDFTDFTLANFVKVYHNVQGTWAYKESPFQTFRSLILDVTFCVEALAQDAAGERLIRTENEGYVADRQSRGHFRAPSAGSVFKNDRRFGKPSGQLIDEAGLKGLAVGGAQIAPWHGNFIINTGSARAGDIRALVERAQAAVRERTGFVLEPEVIFV